MNKIFFIEDILLEFCRLHSMHGFVAVHNEFRTLSNFQSIIENNEHLTQSQGNLLIKILKKYQAVAKSYNFDYEKDLESPQWRLPFRILDLTKKIFLQVNEDNEKLVCLKFPYQLKEAFDLEFPPQDNHSIQRSWDPEQKIRKIPVDVINIIHLYEWSKKNNFEYSEDFLNLVNLVENLWSNEDKIVPYSKIYENSVILFNSNEDSDNYFEKNSLGKLEHDLFLAKLMNFPLKLDSQPKNVIEKLCSSKDNIFWIKEMDRFFELMQKIQGKICVLIDRASERETWLKKFVEIAEKYPSERDVIKVCFRDDKQDKGNFNQWVKDNNLGGSVGDGKYLIFENKPAKWLFRDNIDVKIIVTNNLYINSNMWVNDWMTSHPCVIYLSDVKPTLKRIRNIDSL